MVKGTTSRHRQRSWWKKYGPCGTCKAEAGEPCLDIRSLTATVVRYRTEIYFPHKGREKA